MSYASHYRALRSVLLAFSALVAYVLFGQIFGLLMAFVTLTYIILTIGPANRPPGNV